MYCDKCKAKMVEMGRSYHKQRKWICPRCRRVRMQRQRTKPKNR